MKILIINKFLYPNGGSETYIFKLGSFLQEKGHDVQYFGMEHEGRCVGNAVGAYTSDMDFHGGTILNKLNYAWKTIYSAEARKQLGKVLDSFAPDVCHINNFNYQLTPSILLEIVKWRHQRNRDCRIILTAHDYQLVCPNHMCNNPATHKNCEKCLGGHFWNCVKNKCIHGSIAKSFIGTLEAYFWSLNKAYRYIDTIVCCSEFLKTKLDTNPVFASKTVVLHNFVDKTPKINFPAKDYILYFGRYSWEKGVRTLLEAAKALPDIPFVFAGKGEYAEQMKNIKNVRDTGYRSGEELDRLIREAKFSVCPSECYENCPFSIMESQERLTPVLGARIGGIPE